jgi:hypothetical protein
VLVVAGVVLHLLLDKEVLVAAVQGRFFKPPLEMVKQTQEAVAGVVITQLAAPAALALSSSKYLTT